MDHFLIFVQHHWLLWLAFALIVSCLFWLEAKEQGGGVFLTPTDATLWINHQEAQVIDIRSPEQFNRSHIIGAVSIPLQDLQQGLGSTIEKDKALLLVDQNGQNLSKAIVVLQKAGYTQIKGLRGGIVQWQNASLPLVKGEANK